MDAAAPIPMKRAAVIIPNYNGRDDLPICLDALALQTFEDMSVIVVDNASTDDSLEMVRSRYPDVTAVALTSNGGFSSAVNAGIRNSESEYVVLLNADTRAAPDWLERLVQAMDDLPEAGFGASKLVRFGEPDVIDAAGDGFVPATLCGTTLGAGEPASRYGSRAWVFGACAAAAIYRRSMLNDIGLFDEDFFLTHEDTDVSMRAQNAGYRCVFVPEAQVEHKRRVSYELTTPKIEAIGIRNRFWVVVKNAPPLALAWWCLLAFRHAVLMTARKVAWSTGGKTAGEPTGARWTRAAVRDELWPILCAGARVARAKRRSVRRTRRQGSVALLRAANPSHQPVLPPAA